MKTVYEIMREQRQELEEFISPLSRGWETVLFKAIDILHDIDRRGKADTRQIVNMLNLIILNGKFDESLANQGIQAVRELSYEADRELLEKLNKVQELLFAVKVSMGGRKSDSN
jgi:hypothetical protein